jgi:hypothetical protein
MNAYLDLVNDLFLFKTPAALMGRRASAQDAQGLRNLETVSRSALGYTRARSAVTPLPSAGILRGAAGRRVSLYVSRGCRYRAISLRSQRSFRAAPRTALYPAACRCRAICARFAARKPEQTNL